MNEQPQITVILSVLDGERFLNAALDSILTQSFQDFEFLITDDGSSDLTATILNDYADRHNNIRLFRNNNSLGLPRCLNMMAKKARGKYLARMDADDIAHVHRFKRQIELMENRPDLDVCFTDVDFMTEDGRIICARKTPSTITAILDMLPLISYFTHPTAFFRHSSFKKAGGYNELWLKGQDWELWQRMANAGMRMEILEETLLDYRLNMTGSSLRLLSGSAAKSEKYLEANILAQNGQKIRALSLFSALSFLERLNLFARVLMPQSLFFFLVKVRAKYLSNSPQKRLLAQINSKK